MRIEPLFHDLDTRPGEVDAALLFGTYFKKLRNL
jgi:hypothetical protein